MNNNIPVQLRNPDFRFFLVATNSKRPIEKRWNTDNSYMFFESKLHQHIKEGGNIGICTGYGNLIVIDFDDEDYQKEKQGLLPRTFTTKTAGKQLKHMYYYLKGKMIRKVGIDIGEKRVADIQAGKDGIMCPPSKINRRLYTVVDDRPIRQITCSKLTEVFGFNKFRESKRRKEITQVQPEKIQETIDLFLALGIIRTNHRHFKCPFHKMHGSGNLYVFDDGSVYCFHCQKSFKGADHFKKFWEQTQGGITLII